MVREGTRLSADLLRASLSSTRTELAEVFPHLTDDMLAWAPSEGMRSIHGQLVEILGTEVQILQAIKGGPKRDYEDIEAEYWAVKTVAGLIKELKNVRANTLDALTQLTEDQLHEPATISEGFAKYLELEAVPKGELFRFIVRHEAYHTGQLASYLWARGDNPYNWN